MHPSYTFYHEFTSADRVDSNKTCLAVKDDSARTVIGSTTNNLSPVGPTSASMDYLKRFCQVVSESDARAFHPALFDYLDNFNA